MKTLMMIAFLIFLSTNVFSKCQKAYQSLLKLPDTHFAEEMDLSNLTLDERRQLTLINRELYKTALKVINQAYKSKHSDYLKLIAAEHNMSVTGLKAKIRLLNNKNFFCKPGKSPMEINEIIDLLDKKAL
jgi:hypothetical protein